MVTVVLSFMLTCLLLMFFFSGYADDLSAADVEHFDALSHDLSFRGWD